MNAQKGRLQEAADELAALNIATAIALFTLAENEGIDPDLCAAGRWQCYMVLGDFESAWRESDHISARGKADPNRFWDGLPLNGKRVLIRCLHGLGDTIQFIRYATAVSTIASHLTIVAQPALKRLIGDSGLAGEVITWGDAEPEWDSQVEVMELPRIFCSTLSTIPRVVPYLNVCGAKRPCTGLISGALKVGIVWSSGAFNPARSIPMEELAPLLSIAGIEFFAFQYGPEHNHAEPWRALIRDLQDSLSTIDGTARAMCGLDLLITVDTMAAHLAGALAVPVWTLLPYQCDWRWMLGRDDCAWYPTMRLFRQPSSGNWPAVVERVGMELLALLRRTHRNGYSAAAGTVK